VNGPTPFGETVAVDHGARFGCVIRTDLMIGQKRWRKRTIDWSYPYPRVWWPDHPMATSGGMVKIHRVIGSEMIGRKLQPSDHVHHKNEDRADWSKKNLEVLTAAEHNRKHNPRRGETRSCGYCGEPIYVFPNDLVYSKSFCDSKCMALSQNNVDWPLDETLKEMLMSRPASAIATELGVSGPALKKRCRKHGIETRPRGFWQKQHQ
jgi:hypothetical protein